MRGNIVNATIRPKTPNITPTTTPINAPVLKGFEEPPAVVDPFVESEALEEVEEEATGKDVEVAALRQAVLVPDVTLNILDFTIPPF